MENAAVQPNLSLPPKAFWPLLGLLALVAAAKPILIDTLDPDCFWHLLVADQLWHDGIGPLIDHISFSSQTTPWTPYSWLAELAMRGLWECGGYRASLVAHAAILALLVFTVGAAAVEMVRRSVSKTYAAVLVATGAGFNFILPWLSYRPAAFTVLLLAIMMWLLQRDRRLGERSKAIWFIPLLTVLAINTHIFAVLAPCWIAALLLGAIWERVRCRASAAHFAAEACGTDDGRQHATKHASDGAPTPSEAWHLGQSRNIFRYLMLLLLSLTACCATPMLPGVIQTIVYYQFSDPLVHSQFIVEMLPFYVGIFGKVLLFLLGILLLVIARQRSNVRAGEWLMLLLGLTLLVQHGRFAPLCALTLVPLVTLTLTNISDHNLARPKFAGTWWMLLAVGLIAFGLYFPSAKVPMDTWLNRRGPELPGYPAKATDYVLAHVTPTHHRIINEFTWGGYLAWRLQGRYQMLMDGRTQIRPAAFWNAAYLQGDAERATLLANVQADTAILPAMHSVLSDALLHQSWHQVYADDFAVVLVPPTAESTLHPRN